MKFFTHTVKMFLVLGFFALTFSVTNASAAESTNVCALQSESHGAQVFKSKYIDIRKTKNLGAELMSMVNLHLKSLQYIKTNLTFSEVLHLFNRGTEQSNDLYIYFFRAPKTEEFLVEVMTWPGENPYSHVFNKQGELVGFSEDGTYYLWKDGKYQFCD